MTSIWSLFRRFVQTNGRSMWLGAALTVAVLVAGAALIGLSGWFITAAAVAGIAGLGGTFDVFRPSAGVRFLALGRTASRYFERLSTHDATLRFLSMTRVETLRAMIRAKFSDQIQLRASNATNRLMSDIDVLDSIPLRMVFPIVGAVVTLFLAAIVLGLLIDWATALLIVSGYFIGGTAIVIWGGRASLTAAQRQQAFLQVSRSRMIDVIRGRDDLIVYGTMQNEADKLHAGINVVRQESNHLARVDRQLTAAISMLGQVMLAIALFVGVSRFQAGDASAPMAALGVFAALGLSELLPPVKRAAIEYGRVKSAAIRVDTLISGGTEPAAGQVFPMGFDLGVPNRFTAKAGETVVLTGASGAGKSTILHQIAGLQAGAATIGGVPVTQWPETQLRDHLTMLPQRSVLMPGTLRGNFHVANPDLSDDAILALLDTVLMSDVVADRQGLDTVVGPNGSGFSGGQLRRLVLARALARRPDILLLDEPTEGLDEKTARQVMHNLRIYLPDAVIVIAAHRQAEIDAATRVVHIG